MRKTEDVGGQWAARSIHVLTLKLELISAITVFGPPIGPNLFPAFGLPLVLSEAPISGLCSTPLLTQTVVP